MTNKEIGVGEVYPTGLLWPGVVFASLFSVLSSRPFVASELDGEIFSLFIGRGVPGPFTFLRNRSCESE